MVAPDVDVDKLRFGSYPCRHVAINYSAISDLSGVVRSPTGDASVIEDAARRVSTCRELAEAQATHDRTGPLAGASTKLASPIASVSRTDGSGIGTKSADMIGPDGFRCGENAAI
jgi:hypothetical protein